MKNVNKKHFSRFKGILRESTRKDWDEIISIQCWNSARYVQISDVRLIAVKQDLTTDLMTSYVREWLYLVMSKDLAKHVC